MAEISESSRIASALQDHNFLTGTVATAILYGYARINVSFFAWAAGIHTSDLDLGSEDYLFLALLWAGMTSVCFFFFVAQQRSVTRSIERGAGAFGHLGQHVFGVVALALFYTTTLLLFPSLSFIVAVFIVVLGGPVTLAVVYLTVRLASLAVGPATIGLMAASLFLLSTSATSAFVAGAELADDVSESTQLPLPLQLVLTPHHGYSAEQPDVCVRRVAPRVFVIGGEITVVPESVEFRSTDCVSDAP